MSGLPIIKKNREDFKDNNLKQEDSYSPFSVQKEVKDFRVLFVYPNQMAGVVPGSLAILSACLKKAGFQTKLFDASLYNLSTKSQDEVREKFNQVKKTELDKYFSYKKEDIFEDFVKTVKEYKPNLITTTAVDETLSLGAKLLNKIKEFNIPFVVGGLTAVLAAEKVFEDKAINIVCVGEGEEAIVELCEKMYKGEDYSNVRNFYIRNKEGTIKKNPLRTVVNLNNLPHPDYSIYDDSRFFRPFHGEVVRMVVVDTDRGCPYNCTFCAAPALRDYYKKTSDQQYYRRKSISKIIDEIKYLIKEYNLNFIWFSSETFLARPIEELRELAKRYKEEINLPFWCQTRLDTFNEEKINLLKDMGCKAMSLGLEHGDEKIRNEILKKQLSDEQVIKAAHLIAGSGIIATINSMIGIPDETKEDVFKTIEMNRKLHSILKGKCSLNTFTFSPYYGTSLRELSIKRGYLKDPTKTPNFYSESILEMPSMSKKEILGFEKTLPLYIKLPKEYFPQIEIAKKDDEEGRAMFEKLRDISNNLSMQES